MWVTSKEFRKKYNITSQHLYQLKKNGKVKWKQLFDRTYLYFDDLDACADGVALYARVSTAKQKADLDNQIDYLKRYCVGKGWNPGFVLSDIGSGMNDGRKGLNGLLDLVFQRKVARIIVTHKDRLARFGFGYIEHVCNAFGCSIEVIDAEDDKPFQQELADDLISIVHHFSMRFYGRRRNKAKEIETAISELK